MFSTAVRLSDAKRQIKKAIKKQFVSNEFWAPFLNR